MHLYLSIVFLNKQIYVLLILDFKMLPTTVKLVSKLQPNLAQTLRNMNTVSGPPQVRISFAEKVAHGIAIVLGVTATPIYVLVNLKHYRER